MNPLDGFQLFPERVVHRRERLLVRERLERFAPQGDVSEPDTGLGVLRGELAGTGAAREQVRSRFLWPEPRLELGRAKALITVDGTSRRGKPVDAKAVVDEAAAGALRETEYYRWIFENEPEWQDFR